MIVFALKHKAGLMPQRMSRTSGGKGLSHWPESSGYHGSPPRLFTTEHAAKVARAAWLKGRWDRSYFDPEDGEVLTVRDVGRKPEDLEIVQMELS